MKIIVLLLLNYILVFAQTYYAKHEPYEIRDIAANISGLVVFADETKEGSLLGNMPYLIIDNELDKKELLTIEKKIVFLEKSIKNNNIILENLEKSLNKKEENYKRIEKLTIKSLVEKDKEFHDLVASQNQYLSTDKELQNLEIQIADLKLRAETLKKNIKDKTFTQDGFILYSLLVKQGEVVSMGTKVAKLADLSKAKLVIYLDSDDLKNIDKKIIYLDGIKTDYKLTRIIPIADSINISKYMAQIITKSPKLFSKLIKVELRDE